MGLDFKPARGDFFKDETFRGDFTFQNSPAAIRRFPFPFDRDDYMYSVNIEPHVVGRKGSVFEHVFDVDEHYVAEMIDRAKVLAEDPLRCQSLPHMTLAGWDLLELIMESYAAEYPQWFSLTKTGNSWHWVNRPLGIDQRFTFLDESTLPYGTGVTGVLTLGAKSDFDRQLARLPGDPDAISSARSHEKTLALVTDVLGGAAIVSAAITVILYLGAGESSSSRAASIRPYVNPTGAGAAGSF